MDGLPDLSKGKNIREWIAKYEEAAAAVRVFVICEKRENRLLNKRIEK